MPSPSIPAVVPWASDANYPAGAQSWNATPTKVDPGAGKDAEGWDPSEKPTAQNLNYLFNVWTQWLAFITVLFDANGFLRRGSLVRHLASGAGILKAGAAPLQNNYGIQTTANTTVWRVPIPMQQNERLQRVKVSALVANASADTVTMQVGKYTTTLGSAANPVFTNLGGANAGGVGGTAADGNWHEVDSGAIADTADGGHSFYFIDFSVPVYAVGIFIGDISVTTDVPLP